MKVDFEVRYLKQRRTDILARACDMASEGRKPLILVVCINGKCEKILTLDNLGQIWELGRKYCSWYRCSIDTFSPRKAGHLKFLKECLSQEEQERVKTCYRDSI
jgi:hypothetical protein